MKLERNWKCAVCGEAVILDTNEKTLKCLCGTVHFHLEQWSFAKISEYFHRPLQTKTIIKLRG
jgi:hypothetical protein